MTQRYDRDLIGCANDPPDPNWPGGARLARLLDYVARHSGVWITPCVDIARHSIATLPDPGRGLNE